MIKRGLVGLGLIAVAVFAILLIASLKRVPRDGEGLLVSDRGQSKVYGPGWHLIQPKSGKFFVYPAGELSLRYPSEGTARIRVKDGREAEVAFSFRIRIPSGSAEHLYVAYGEGFPGNLDEIFRDAIEIQAAKFIPGTGDAAPPAYAAAVAQDLQEAFSSGRLTLVSAKIESWNLKPGEGAGITAEVAQEPLRKIVFIGVDGADWLIINPLIDKGSLPNLETIITDGASGPLRSIEPLLSPLIWTTMATGKLPEDHGILNFTVVDPSTGKKVPITRLYRKVDAFWNMLGDYGRSVDVIGWLATYPAEKINGKIVSDRVGYLAFASPEDADAPPPGAVYPSEIQEAITNLLVKSSDVPFDELEKIIHIDEATFHENKILPFDPKNPINNMILIYASALSYRNIALRLLEEDRPDVLAVYFEFVDAVGHLFMPYAPPKQDDISDEDYQKFKDAIEEAYAIQDRIIGEMLQECDENTVVIIASDHGFKSGDARLKASAEIWGGHAAHWHRIEGVICMYGNGIRPGYKIEGASIIDITPTILALAGFPRVSDMPGKVLWEAFDEPLRESLNPTVVATLERIREEEQPGTAPEGAADDVVIKKLEALGYLTPENPDALNNLGQRYQKQGEYEKAIVEYKKALALRPNFASALNNMGICYGSLGRYPDAEDSFLRAIKANPKDIFAMNNLAVMYLKTRQFEQARRYAESAIEIEPKYANAHITLGSAYAMAGELELAEREFQTALEIEPGNKSALANLERLRKEKKEQK